jgi:prepilin-type N-terminal cleavage/methylation domain-containing protein
VFNGFFMTQQTRLQISSNPHNKTIKHVDNDNMKVFKNLRLRQLTTADERGLSLAELLIAVAIVGILGAISLPSYVNEVQKSRQREAVAVLSQIQIAIAAYGDEFGDLPESWKDLDKINAVMTDNGPAQKGNFSSIILAGGLYNVEVSNKENNFTISAQRTDKSNLNILACVNLTNGASGMNLGEKDSPASTPNC